MGTQLEEVYNYMMQYAMVSPGDRLVVGLSGGADSVCLLHMLCSLAERLGINHTDIIAVHVHHGLRGQEADRDAEFSKNLCDTLGVGFELYKTDINKYAEENGLTVEEAGRKYRYACFEECCIKYECNRIAVAHNKNDLAETVIFHMLRGSGIRGMRGILPVRDTIIRPLLDMDRSRIVAYLSEVGMTYCEDATNASCDYDRNKIRHVILPAMEHINTGFLTHICNLAKDADAYYTLTDKLSEQAYDVCVTELKNKYSISIVALEKLERLIQRNICYKVITNLAGSAKDITSQHVDALLHLCSLQSGSEICLPYALIARKSYDAIIVQKSKDYHVEDDCFVPQEIFVPGVYDMTDWGTIKISLVKRENIEEISKNQYTKMFDYDKIYGSLCLRRPEEGDFISVNAAGNTKKLSRLFIDCKIDRQKRSCWPVIACEASVVWVVGLRESYQYRVESQTQNVLVVQYIRKGEQNGRENQCAHQ